MEEIPGKTKAQAPVKELLSKLKMSKTDVKFRTVLITRHCMLSIKLTQNPTCNGCEKEKKRSLQLMYNCETFVNSRRNTVGTEKRTLAQLKKLHAKKLQNFIQETGPPEEQRLVLRVHYVRNGSSIYTLKGIVSRN